MENKFKQTITLTDKNKLVITAVSSVLTFDDDYMKISTDLGTISVQGKGLEINDLSKEKREIAVQGDISLIEYIDSKKKK